MDNDRLVEVNPVFEQIAKAEGFYSEELIEKIAEQGTAAECEEIPEHWRSVLVTAHDIEPEWHIRMQAAFQKYTDNAVSKTINFPHSAGPEQVAEAYRLAYRLGCKGITVYRDGSLDNQPMQRGLNSHEPATPPQTGSHTTVGEWGKILPIKRPKRLTGVTDARLTPEGNLYLTLNLNDNHPFELFAQIGKAGSDISAFTEAIARLISLAFRCGVDPEAVADELIGIGGSRFVGFGPNRVRSVPDAIGQFLNEYLQKLSEENCGHDLAPQLELGLTEMASSAQPAAEPQNEKKTKVRFNLCPSCGMYTFGYFEGCAKCLSCGHSEC
jgi:ribonucleoside-diphosphate reductase alpha chain